MTLAEEVLELIAKLEGTFALGKEMHRRSMIGGAISIAIAASSFISAENPLTNAPMNQVAVGTTHVVRIKDFKFVPERLTVKLGDRVTWKNLDVVPHTATAGDQSWDSAYLAKDAEWSLTIEDSTALEYICTYHPSMKGQMVIGNHLPNK